MKTRLLASAFALSSAIGLALSAGTAWAAALSLTPGPDAGTPAPGTIPQAGTNELLPLFGIPATGDGHGYFGATVTTGAAQVFRIDFFGAEAGNRNQFAAPGGTVLFTTTGDTGAALDGVNRATSLATPLDTAFVLLGPGTLDFRFIINSIAGDFVANGANPNDLAPPAGPNFFATFDIGWDPVARGGPGPLSGDVLYLFLDDANQVDDNHDDMLVRISAVPVPEPAGLALLGAGLLALGLARRRRRG